MKHLFNIVDQFNTQNPALEITPLGSGLINDTYLVKTAPGTPNYVLQRINHNIFTDVDLLQRNIEAVTNHIRAKLIASGIPDVERRVLRFIPLKSEPKTYYRDSDGNFWRISVFIDNALTISEVSPKYARHAGEAFGEFQAMLTDIPVELGETIPDFHNMEFRLKQFHDAINENRAGRLDSCKPLVDDLLARGEQYTQAERLYRQGLLPKRICHCDTKVNNMMFSPEGQVLCVIDLDTVMPSFIFSDFGDFLRTAASTAAEDEPNLSKVNFNIEIFKAFAQGYLNSTSSFLTPLEKKMLPWSVALFPYMQAVRFLTDYLNGDTYYKIAYPEHNLVRTRAQHKLLQSVEAHTPQMEQFIAETPSQS